MVDGRDLCLAALELSIRIQQVIDGRDEVVMPHAARQIARKGGQIAQPALVVLCHQHAQHLAGAQFIGPIGAGSDITLHLPDRHQRQRMRLIAERARELLRQLYGRRVNFEKMELFSHQVQNYIFYHPLWPFSARNVVHLQR